MGEEISRSEFEAADFARFNARLAGETALLREQFGEGRLASAGYAFGFEIEVWLLDHGYFPNSINEAFLARLDHPLVVPELSRFNVELNSVPLPLRGDALLRAEMELERLWGVKTFLELWVKVRSGWADSEEHLRSYGYE